MIPILVRERTEPQDLAGMIASAGIITQVGGATCHAALVARELGKPCITGVESIESLPKEISMDGGTGHIYSGLVPIIGGGISPLWQVIDGWSPPDINRVWDTRCDINQSLTVFYTNEDMIAKGEVPSIDHFLLKRELSEFFFSYLVHAIAGELRHASDKSQCKTLEKLRSFVPVCRGLNRLQTQMALKIDNSSLDEFLSIAHAVFCCTWESGFGGQSWSQIVEAVQNFRNGQWSETIFIDHAFDLRHNGGLAFDKHPNCRCYSDDLRSQLEIKLHGKYMEGLARYGDYKWPLERHHIEVIREIESDEEEIESDEFESVNSIR